MTTLHLGVIDFAYGHEDPARPGRKPQETPNESTGDVAEILEDKYHVMEIFWQLHGQEIADALGQAMLDAMESRAMGAPEAGHDPTGTAMAMAKHLFSRFLESKEMDGLGIPGVPTKAALDGVSHRFKDKKGAAGRPSFVDTGDFEASFRAWMEG